MCVSLCLCFAIKKLYMYDKERQQQQQKNNIMMEVNCQSLYLMCFVKYSFSTINIPEYHTVI